MKKMALPRKLFFVWFVFLFASLEAPGQPQGKTVSHTIHVGDRERTYLLHLPPAYDGKRNLPLVIVLHGGGGNAENVARMTRMSEKADTERFIVAYPNGTHRFFRERILTWNAGNCCGYALDNQVDDVGFLRALIEKVQHEYKIDSARVYATGISNGGMMAYRLACELSDKIAAIAPVAGALNFEPCKPAHPVSVVHFHGTDDEHVLYEGGVPKKQLDHHPRTDKSVSFAVSYWTEQNGCSAKPEKTLHESLIIERYKNGRNGTEVVLYTIRGGKHSWPGGTRGWLFGDEPSNAVSATDAQREFFLKHPKQYSH